MWSGRGCCRRAGCASRWRPPAHADAMLVSGEGERRASVAERLGVRRVRSRCTATVGPPVEETVDGPAPLEPGARVVLVSGIARPERFVRRRGAGLRRRGAMCVPRSPSRSRRPTSTRIAQRVRDTGADDRAHDREGPGAAAAAAAAGRSAWPCVPLSVARRAGRSVRSLARRRDRGRGTRARLQRPARVRHRLEYLAVVALVRGVVRVLPDAVGAALGALLGLTFYALDRVHRRVAETNLATAFPKRQRPSGRRSRARCSCTSDGCCSSC